MRVGAMEQAGGRLDGEGRIWDRRGVAWFESGMLGGRLLGVWHGGWMLWVAWFPGARLFLGAQPSGPLPHNRILPTFCPHFAADSIAKATENSKNKHHLGTLATLILADGR